ncbi:hypothetical protein P5673_017992 [Acropora cervicornis]|uniref:Uncharacterized protein n=1 Tax=Acropora cervicornis TaxID=6130 RepID=A0AAD9QDP2_ACRCE|nr:hypothetical protein P5673_017992 [Acropora cervicornis]
MADCLIGKSYLVPLSPRDPRMSSIILTPPSKCEKASSLLPRDMHNAASKCFGEAPFGLINFAHRSVHISEISIAKALSKQSLAWKTLIGGRASLSSSARAILNSWYASSAIRPSSFATSTRCAVGHVEFSFSLSTPCPRGITTSSPCTLNLI